MSVKKIYKSVLVVLVLLSACSGDEVQYKKNIIGSWKQEDALKSGGVLHRTFIFSPDGTFTVSAKRIEGEKTTSYTSEGTWTIEGETLHYTILKSTHSKVPEGYKHTNRIISITEKEVVSANPVGKVTTAYRIAP
jgi:hypothetical protein